MNKENFEEHKWIDIKYKSNLFYIRWIISEIFFKLFPIKNVLLKI